jgi:hypothetical protein
VKSSAEIGVSVSVDPDNPTPALAGWFATFVYRYNVGGVQRTGNRLRFTPFSPRHAHRAAAKYLPDHGVRVAVHPTKHDLSVLEVGPTALGIAAFVASLVLTVLGVSWIIGSLR